MLRQLFVIRMLIWSRAFVRDLSRPPTEFLEKKDDQSMSYYETAAELVYASKWGLTPQQNFKTVGEAIEWARSFSKEAINYCPERSETLDRAFSWAVLNDGAAGQWQAHGRFSNAALQELNAFAEQHSKFSDREPGDQP